MAETRAISERYAGIGMDLIRTEPSLAALRDSEATVCYLSSDAARTHGGRAVLGQCERVPAKWAWAVPCDFTITVYEPNCAGMDEGHLRRLLFHELLHVGVERTDEGEERHFVRPHDLEDFRECVDRWGVDWERN